MMKTENYSPLDPITSIMLGAPGTEALMCLTIPPEISLFEANASGNVSVADARKDHERMQGELEREGIEVFNMREIIAQVLAERANHPYHSREDLLNELMCRAEFLLNKYKMPVSLGFVRQELEELLDMDIKQMGLEAAIAINAALTNVIGIDGKPKNFDPKNPPAGNFLFWRDTNHIIGGHMGVHRMFYSIRDQEVAFAKLGFDALGLVYHQLDLKGGKNNSIEGGDILPMELGKQLYALIGKAERTSWGGVQAWFKLHEHEFSQSGAGLIPAIVEGPHSGTQDQMHLDTFSQQVAPGAIIHCGEITKRRNFSILMRRRGEIIKVKPENLKDGTYAEWIESQADHIYDMTQEEQLNYAPNVLVSGDGSEGTTVFITRDGTPAVTSFIRKHATSVVLLKMNDLTKFYGGAHCATSEMR